MNKEIKFSIIGCGRIAKNHIGPINDIDGTKLVGLCDLRDERVSPLADQERVPKFTNYHQMLDEIDTDVVCVLTPSGMHPSHVIDIINKYKKHVIVEKPMALRLSDIDLMENAALLNNVKIFPVYQNRYNKAVKRVREDIINSAFGKLVLGTVRVRWCRPQEYYNRDKWRGTWAMDGGALTNQGIHYIDILQHLMGDIKSVNAKMATQLVGIEVEDTFVATVVFENNALGSIEGTTAARPDDFEASISILGENGTAILGGLACNKLDCYTFSTEIGEAHSVNIPDAYGFGHWDFYKDLIYDLQGFKSHPISFKEGSRAITLLNSLYASAEMNKEVYLKDKVSSKNLGKKDLKIESLYTVK